MQNMNFSICILAFLQNRKEWQHGKALHILFIENANEVFSVCLAVNLKERARNIRATDITSEDIRAFLRFVAEFCPELPQNCGTCANRRSFRASY